MKDEEYRLPHVEQTYLPSSSRHVKRFLKSRREFMRMLDESGYTLISQYVGVDDHASVICPEGHTWDTCSFTNFRKGVRCRACKKQCPKLFKQEFLSGLEKAGYTLLGDYVNSSTNVIVVCDKEHLWETCNPGRFNQGARCKTCDGQCPNEARERFDKLLERQGDRRLSEYNGANSYITILFTKCGHVADKITPSKYKERKRCPTCSLNNKESHLATFTKELAQQIFDSIIPEYKILRNEETQYYLPFDIYIKSINMLIEIHGHQHYEFNTLYHKDEQDFLYRQQLDRLKKEWAISNGYKFIEIDIRNHDEEYVTKLLKELKNEEEINNEY